MDMFVGICMRGVKFLRQSPEKPQRYDTDSLLQAQKFIARHCEWSQPVDTSKDMDQSTMFAGGLLRTCNPVPFTDDVATAENIQDGL